MTTRTALLLALLIPGTAHADTISIDLGHIDFMGNFTVTACCGTGFSLFRGFFDPQIVTDATGLFAPYVRPGDQLLMGASPIFIENLSVYPEWRIGGFTIETLQANAAGRYASVSALMHLTGNGYDITPNAPEPGGGIYGAGWGFDAPLYEDHAGTFAPVIGPITLRMGVGIIRQVPDGGSTLTLLVLGVAALSLCRRH